MNHQTAALAETLTANGHRLTPAREAILNALVKSGGHITADGLAEVVHRDAPQVGRMTVYRTLDLLSALGVIHPVYQGSGAAHYVLLHGGHHHHLICTRCRQVIEFDECALAELAETVSRRFGFQVHGHLLEFYGRCADCDE